MHRHLGGRGKQGVAFCNGNMKESLSILAVTPVLGLSGIIRIWMENLLPEFISKIYEGKDRDQCLSVSSLVKPVPESMPCIIITSPVVPGELDGNGTCQ